ncbi:MAG TPA: bifunctional adenosylcobinamide kinase/adenosylcobinamide-phosphate guanylyltransferase [Nitrospiraceae bacterium]|nr:bifunctional adenosylcobinamide kinase/adenosylcobinamide-phosphate guanylyltransferase [Nitrospiraceae bacterium]
MFNARRAVERTQRSSGRSVPRSKPRRPGSSPVPTKKSGRQQSKLILVLGGAASGKSQTALDLAGGALPRAFVATGQDLDQEMAERIRRHRASRAPDWHTAEVPIDLVGWLRTHGSHYRTIVVDCLTLWLSNLQEQRVPDPVVPERVDELLQAIGTAQGRIILVSNELGLGVVPMSQAGRRFRDVSGKMHQQIAAAADEVYFILAGLTLRLK